MNIKRKDAALARNIDLAYESAGMGSSDVGDVGRLLRDARESVGMDLRDVADRLRIRYMYLEAIEDGRYGDLPGPTYAVGFIRAYADLLGLDQHEVAQRFKEESDTATAHSDLVFPVPVNEGGLPSAAVLLVAAVLGAGVYGFWYWASSADRSVVEVIQDVPERLMSALDEALDDSALDGLAQAEPETPQAEPPAASTKAPETVAAEPAAAGAPLPSVAVAPTEPEPDPAVEPVAPETAAPLAALPTAPPTTSSAETVGSVAEESLPSAEQQDAPSASVPPQEDEPAAEIQEPVENAVAVATEESAAQPVPEPVAPAEDVAAQSNAAPAPAAPPAPQLSEDTDVPVNGRVFGEENAGARVVLRARADAWVQVRDGDELLLTRLLRRGDSYFVPNRAGLTLMTGNAGGIVVEVDGARVPPLGRTGEVKRGIPLDVETLQATAGSTN